MTAGTVPASERTGTAAYPDGFAQITDYLLALDRLIEQRVAHRRDVLRPRARFVADGHLHVSDAEIDRLLGRPPQDVEPGRETDLTPTELVGRAEVSAAEGVRLPLRDLARMFQLSPFAVWAVIVCLAPELDRKYGRIYAYLQDDVTRTRPSADLVLDLLCDSPAERAAARAQFAISAPLRAAGILHIVDDPGNPSGRSDPGRSLRLDDRIRSFLDGYEAVAEDLSDVGMVRHPTIGLDDLFVDPEPAAQLLAQIRQHVASGGRVLLGLHGSAPVGRLQFAEGLCGELGCSLTIVDARRWIGRERELPGLLRLAFRECLLHQGALYLDGLDALLDAAEVRAPGIVRDVGRAAATFSRLSFLGLDSQLRLDELPAEVLFHAVDVPCSGPGARAKAWQHVLATRLPGADPTWAEQLATGFVLTPHQIDAVAARVAFIARGNKSGPVSTLPGLLAACRDQSSLRLGDLAIRIAPSRGRSDLILPAAQLDQLDELCAHVRHRITVFDEWGFSRMAGRGQGLSALLVGLPGTGKTLAAEVVAGALGVDLYSIDLSGVVSKYIGETEKNLSSIFQAAENSNAILFFDEADALFGKRTEVADAHDRYANIETSYLLQKMEAYDGVVLLATNQRENIDDAFGRRFRFIVEFPFPDDAGRAMIWRNHLPASAPLAADIDVLELGKEFPLSGAGIRNAALAAAFAAAEDGVEIGMSHVRHGIRREYEKIGKLWTGSGPAGPTQAGRGE